MFELIFAAFIEFSNVISCGSGSFSCCEMQYLTVVTSHENFWLVQESFKDLLNIFSACACAACFSLAVAREFC